MTDQHWFIFRHGLATHSKTGYGDKIVTAEVLPEGIPPIQRIGQYLKSQPYEVGYRSEFLRCQQTAAIVTLATGHPFTPDARLNELHQQTFDEVVTRVRAFVDEMQASHHRYIWVCTHGFVIAAMRHLILDGRFEKSMENNYTQTGQILKLHGGEESVLDFNQVV